MVALRAFVLYTKIVARQRQRIFWLILLAITAWVALGFAWFHFTNPYAALNVVQQPNTTAVLPSGEIAATKQFNLQTWGGGTAELVGYAKSGFLIVQNAWFGSYKAPSQKADDIIRDINTLRFDPRKPYLISGDQFSVLYPRNLGVFYNSLLDPHTAHSQENWENRQRIYLQSALYALDAFSAAGDLTTTIVPIGARQAVLTQVHPGSVPSDTLYGMLYALWALQDTSAYTKHPQYRLQTVKAAQEITKERRDDLAALLKIYLQQVQSPATGLIKPHVDLASARDGVVRDRSFYDTIVLWKTLSLAKQLAIPMPKIDLAAMRQQILDTYWDGKEGHFKDDMSTKPANANYSSDWLLALPTGFLQPNNPADKEYLVRSVEFMRKQGVTKPLPIKYQATNEHVDAPWAVKTFVPNYGGDAIWSYWGAQYITLLAQLAEVTNEPEYTTEAKQAIAAYTQKIEQYRGFPETFDAKGNFLENSVYKSIRQTGWVVQFEQAKKELRDER